MGEGCWPRDSGKGWVSLLRVVSSPHPLPPQASLHLVKADRWGDGVQRMLSGAAKGGTTSGRNSGRSGTAAVMQDAACPHPRLHS